MGNFIYTSTVLYVNSDHLNENVNLQSHVTQIAAE